MRLTHRVFRIVISNAILTFAGCGGNGALNNSAVLSDIKQSVLTDLSQSVSFDQNVLLTLHRAGSYQEYGKNINCADFSVAVKVRDVNDLMDEAFNRRKADGIEIDLRTVTGSPSFNGVYVSHDAIEPVIAEKGHEAARLYLSRNGIRQVLGHFIARGYDLSDHFLFMELKVPRKSLFANNSKPDDAEMRYLRKSYDEVNATISEVKDPARRRSLVAHLGFISFNPYALEAIHKMDRNGYELHFLAASNRPIAGRVAALLDDELNVLNESISDFAASADWLDGIWFDPRGVDNAAEIFNAINDRRRKKIGIHIFTFKLPYNDLKKRLASYVYDGGKNGKRKLENVRALMFDIRKFDDPDERGSCD